MVSQGLEESTEQSAFVAAWTERGIVMIGKERHEGRIRQNGGVRERGGVL